MPRVKRTLESQNLYIKMLEKLTKDFEADLKKAKEIYRDLEELEHAKAKKAQVQTKPEPKRKGRPAKAKAAAPKRRGRAAAAVAATPKKRGRPPKAK